MKIKSVELEPLELKHYTTKISIFVEGEGGQEWRIGAEVYGYSPKPSQREICAGWEPDHGMDHVETDAEHKIALAIVEALKGKVLQ